MHYTYRTVVIHPVCRRRVPQLHVHTEPRTHMLVHVHMLSALRFISIALFLTLNSLFFGSLMDIHPSLLPSPFTTPLYCIFCSFSHTLHPSVLLYAWPYVIQLRARQIQVLQLTNIPFPSFNAIYLLHFSYRFYFTYHPSEFPLPCPKVMSRIRFCVGESVFSLFWGASFLTSLVDFLMHILLNGY